MPRDQITQQEILGVALFGLRAKLYKVMPGIVTKGGTAEVDVEAAVHDVRFDPELGVRVSEPWPPLLSVPVAWPKWGSFALVGTLAAGDKVLLLSFDLDPSLHRGTGNAEDPVDTSRHSGAYWVAFPADITDAGASALGSPGAFAILGNPSGVQVQIGPSSVSLGAANAPDFVALSSKVDACMALIASHVHTSAAPGNQTTTSPTLAALPATGSAIVKCAP